MTAATGTATPARTAVHASFAIERVYPATPARVFAAWADREAKARWFPCHERYTLDFRVGGRESNRGGPPGGPVYACDALFHDIVPDERIVYGYELRQDDTLVSVSLVTVEFAPADGGPRGGTRLRFTEQGVFLDGHDTPAHREHGTREGLERLVPELRRAAGG
jgi:uncharacterized protein YndB with AHSA1/START domain